MVYVMIEIRVQEDLQHVRVDRSTREPIVWVPQNTSWQALNGHLLYHLNLDELEMAKKIWCQDDFPRTFERGNGYVVIRPADNP